MAGNDTKSTLLCHWNGPDGAKEIVDDGNTGHIVTLNGTAQTSTVQKKIGNCSVLLDGDSDYLTIPDHADWNLGANPFTIEGWFYFTSTGDRRILYQGTAGAGGTMYTVYTQTLDAPYNESLGFGAFQTPGWLITILCPFNPASYQNVWTHLAVVRIDNANSVDSWRMYVNGVAQTITLYNGAYNATLPDCTGNLYIGSTATPSEYFPGYVDEFRISDIARFTVNFTPSTIAYTTDTACSLLIHCESHDIALGGSYLPATFVGTAQLDTAVKTFGTASLLLDGDSDYVSFPDNALWDFGTSAFTIDYRVRFATLTGEQYMFSSVVVDTGDSGIALRKENSTDDLKLFLNGRNTSNTWAWAPSANTWYHIAIVGNGGADGARTITIYIDGTILGSAWTTNYNIINSSAFGIGTEAIASPANYMNGYIDEFRISSIARWTTDFTPPSAEYSEDAPTPPASTRRIFLIT